MFCENCGSLILDEDKFCGSCGHLQSENPNTSNRKFTPVKVIDTGLIKLFKSYFIKPVSFFSEVKEGNLLKSSIALLF